MSDSAALTSSTRSQSSSRPAAYLPIVFAVLAVVGLGLWFSGGGQESEPTLGGLVGAGVLCLAMLSFLGFLAWLARSPRPLVRAGAALFALAGLLHLVENLLVLGPGHAGQTDSPGVWNVILFLSPTAFAVLGLATLETTVDLPAPAWLRVWGVVAGVAGLVSGLSTIVPALDAVPGPFNVLLMGWLIVVGLRGQR